MDQHQQRDLRCYSSSSSEWRKSWRMPKRINVSDKMSFINDTDPWLPVPQAMGVDDVPLSPPPAVSNVWESHPSTAYQLQDSSENNFGQQQLQDENDILVIHEEDAPFSLLETLDLSWPATAFENYASPSVGGAEPFWFGGGYGYEITARAGGTATATIPIASGQFGSGQMGAQLATSAPTSPPLSSDHATAAGTVHLGKKLYELNPDLINDRKEKARINNAIKAKKYRENMKKKMEDPECMSVCDLEGIQLQNRLEIIEEVYMIWKSPATPRQKKARLDQVRLRAISKGKKKKT